MKVAINGFGRIGRAVLRLGVDRGIDVVAINDVHGVKDAAYLLKFDSVYGRYGKNVLVSGDSLVVGGKRIKVLSERDPLKLPWEKLGVDIVVESTGAFRDKKDASKHLKAGAKYVLISATSKDADITLVPGVNEEMLKEKDKIISVASCTTNALAPIAKILNDEFGIERAFLTTIHSYTSSQGLVDGYARKTRRGRAAAVNLVPTTTGATEATTKALPELEGKIDGLAIRAPILLGSLVDLVAELKGKFDVKKVNAAFKKASKGKMKGIIGYSEDELVSSDIIGEKNSALVDSLSTMKDGNLIKVLAWYDNEMGYSGRLIDVINLIEKRG